MATASDSGRRRAGIGRREAVVVVNTELHWLDRQERRCTRVAAGQGLVCQIVLPALPLGDGEPLCACVRACQRCLSAVSHLHTCLRLSPSTRRPRC